MKVISKKLVENGIHRIGYENGNAEFRPETLPESVTIEECETCGYDHRSDQVADDCRADWFGLIPADMIGETIIIPRYIDANGDTWISRDDVRMFEDDCESLRPIAPLQTCLLYTSPSPRDS